MGSGREACHGSGSVKDTLDKITRTVPYEWTTRRDDRSVIVRPKDRQSCAVQQKMLAAETVFVHQGDFYCEIDLEKLLSPLIRKASTSKTGYAKLAAGAVYVHRRPSRIVDQRKVEYPIWAGYEEVSPK